MKIVFVTLLVCITCLYTLAQPQWVIYDTINSGLPDNHVSSIAIDRGGNIWVGTDSAGIAKFDGTTWTIYDTSNSDMPSNKVTAISVDNNNVKWIGTDEGLVRMECLFWTVYNTTNTPLCQNAISAVEADAYGNVWVGTPRIGKECDDDPSCLVKFDGSGWTLFSGGWVTIKFNVNSIDVQDSTHVWVGDDCFGLLKYDGSNWSSFSPYGSPGFLEDLVYVSVDDSDYVWLALKWMRKLVKTKGDSVLASYSLDTIVGVDSYINTLRTESTNTVWAGTVRGLLEYDMDTTWTLWTPFNSSLPDSNIVTITIDSQGNKWIGTDEGGLTIYNAGGVSMMASTSVIHAGCSGGNFGSASVSSVSYGTPPFTYQWNDQSNQTNSTATGLISGAYQVIITDSVGLSISRYAEVCQVSAMAASLSGQNICDSIQNTSTASISLTGGIPPYTYSWSNGDTTATMSSSSPGWYFVNVTDDCGNVLADSIQLQYAPLLVSVATTDVTCNGTQNGSIDLTVSGASTPYTFQWSPGGSSEDLSAIYAGSYSVTVSEATGCELIDTILISEPLPIAVGPIITTPSCYDICDGMIAFNTSGGTPPYSSWVVDPPVFPFFTSLCVGTTYVATVTDLLQCSGSSTFTITNPAEILISSTVNIATAGESDGSILLSVSGGIPAYTYDWSNGASSLNLFNVPGGSYTVTVTDGTNCTSSTIIEIPVFTGLDESNLKSTLRLDPNPTEGIMTVSAPKELRVEKISLFNVLGTNIQVEVSPSNKLDLSSLTNGIYFLRIETNQGTVTRKVVKEGG